MENKYTYEVIKCSGIPLHFVYFKSNSYEGVSVFSTKADADQEIALQKMYWGASYDYNLSIPIGIVREYKENKHLFSKIENKEVYCGY